MMSMIIVAIIGAIGVIVNLLMLSAHPILRNWLAILLIVAVILYCIFRALDYINYYGKIKTKKGISKHKNIKINMHAKATENATGMEVTGNSIEVKNVDIKLTASNVKNATGFKAG